MSNRRPTLKQIAQTVGCSATAVSKVLNGARGEASVGKDLATRITRTAQQMGYVPDRRAQALRAPRVTTIGLLTGSDQQLPFWQTFVGGVLRAAAAADVHVLHVASDAHLLRAWRDGSIERGIVVAAMHQAQLPGLRASDLPLVAVDSEDRGLPVDLLPDLHAGSTAAIDHLAATGHRQLLWCHPTQDGRRIDGDRFPAIAAACQRHGLQLEEVALDAPAADFTWGDTTSAAAAVTAHLAARDCDAVLAYNETIATGALAALHRAGRAIPDEIAVVGYDNVLAPYLHPALSVVDLGLERMGAAAVARCLDSAAPLPAYASAFIPRATTRSLPLETSS